MLQSKVFTNIHIDTPARSRPGRDTEAKPGVRRQEPADAQLASEKAAMVDPYDTRLTEERKAANDGHQAPSPKEGLTDTIRQLPREGDATTVGAIGSLVPRKMCLSQKILKSCPSLPQGRS